jgi:hypothetical protein
MDQFGVGLSASSTSVSLKEPTDERESLMATFVRLDGQFEAARFDRDNAEERMKELSNEREEVRGQIARLLNLHRADEPMQKAAR